MCFGKRSVSTVESTSSSYIQLPVNKVFYNLFSKDNEAVLGFLNSLVEEEGWLIGKGFKMRFLPCGRALTAKVVIEKTTYQFFVGFQDNHKIPEILALDETKKISRASLDTIIEFTRLEVQRIQSQEEMSEKEHQGRGDDRLCLG